MERAETILSFWGKAQPREGTRYDFHPLPCHSLDVAAVGQIWLEIDAGLLAWFSNLLDLPPQASRSLLVRLLALHDIGKFAAAFQIKVPARFPDKVFGTAIRDHLPSVFRHDEYGLKLIWHRFDDVFPSWQNRDRRALKSLLTAITGHHGMPPEAGGYTSSIDELFQPGGVASAMEFAHHVHNLLERPDSLPSHANARRASTAVAGFAVACDWLGSNQQYFPYAESDVGLATYWVRAQKQARSALNAAGLLSSSPAPFVSLQTLLGESTAKPSPLQDWAATTPLLDGPGVYILEDETGSGKTEAALILASRLMAEGRTRGLYMAMPTMATANAIFERLEKNFHLLFEDGATPSLSLVHGRSHLHGRFRSLRLEERVDCERYGDEASASENCARWIADDRRKGFLAQVGIGTIDQALLAILPARFQALRMFGLAQRMLILDEVHAYDAYVAKGIERLIEWQLSLGGSCILLSATLPQVARDRFARALGQNVEVSASYPRATKISKLECSVESIAARKERSRCLPVQFLANPEAALAAVRAAAQQGKAAVYIRNTVDDAVEAYAALKLHGLNADLFHARMALIDRFEAESRIMQHFGKASMPEERAGRILVATQVVEQSLDIDFDVMVTDLAPVDLVIQRAGRLWRHCRPDRHGAPELLVVSPEPDAKAGTEWYARIFPRGRWVYQDHARLWLTAKILHKTGEIATPDGVNTLIEAVYSADADKHVPPGLLPSLIKAEGTASAQISEAARRALDPERGYAHDGPWDDDARVFTRLEDEPQVILRLGIARDGRIVPYAERAGIDLTPAQAWALSEVRVAQNRIKMAVIEPELHAAAEAARNEWGRFDGDKILVVLEAAAGCANLLPVEGIDGRDRRIMVHYAANEGLSFGAPSNN